MRWSRSGVPQRTIERTRSGRAIPPRSHAGTLRTLIEDFLGCFGDQLTPETPRSTRAEANSEAKTRLSEVADLVDRTHDRVHITRNGRDYVVLMSFEDLESLEATIELLSDVAAMTRIRDAEAAIARGETTSAADMAVLMEQRRARERAS